MLQDDPREADMLAPFNHTILTSNCLEGEAPFEHRVYGPEDPQAQWLPTPNEAPF